MRLSVISLKNFKSFESVRIELSNLNVLSGSNSAGKSSIIQALLLLKQNNENIRFSLFSASMEDSKAKIPRFDINGPLVKLGQDGGLLYIDASDDEIVLSVSDTLGQVNVSNCANQHWKVELIEYNQTKKDQSNRLLSKLGSLRRLVPDFKYLSTNRESPDIIYPLSNSDIEDESLGIHGQFTAHYLAKNKSTPIRIKALVHPDSHTDHLLENVSKWLSEISSNIDVSSKIIPEANKAALTYNYTYGHNRSRPITPVNVGFGVTHVLPVITQLLMAKKNDLLIIENPEAHLHPKGQANLARLISLVASQGVQIIIETHSDHILNSIRVCTKEGIISKEKSKIYFFQHNQNSLSSFATEISINSDGSVTSWPSGFFDEWDNQLDKLLW
ncbi:DUF3696 domain-containing protein [Aeromonas sp. XH]|uniref:AAA family ATPase n=1 Tax=Aeromonas sp. XH TaxID=3081770 RepID=UPI000FA9A6BC|nr:DUF3696 domain-containing protein [Aeromonas sp. XH]WOX48270.1 DUF3696 domain-containing protein [Aeromonas sp. XH]